MAWWSLPFIIGALSPQDAGDLQNEIDRLDDLELKQSDPELHNFFNNLQSIEDFLLDEFGDSTEGEMKQDRIEELENDIRINIPTGGDYFFHLTKNLGIGDTHKATRG